MTIFTSPYALRSELVAASFLTLQAWSDQAAVSIAHKDGLSYDEHELVVPFNSTIDRVKVRLLLCSPRQRENM